MKKLLIYGLLAAMLFGNSGAGCSSKNQDDPQPEDIKLMVGGLWEVTKTVTYDPGDKVTLMLKKGALGFKFYTDGKLESCSFGTCAKMGRWSFLLKNGAVGTGTLTMYLEDANQKELFGDQLTGHLEINTDNDIIWVIAGNPTIGTTDATRMEWTMARNP